MFQFILILNNITMAFDNEKARKWFKSRKISNLEISKTMDNYSTSLISRYFNQSEESPKFLHLLRKYYPEAPVDSWIIPDELILEEPETKYYPNLSVRISNVIKELQEINSILSQK